MTASLSSQVRDAAEASGLHDPREIAEKLLAGMDVEGMESALRAALPGYVQAVLGSTQRAALQKVMRPNRSRKRELIRDWWADVVASSVCVDGTWKAVGDCTLADTQWLAERRRVEAARNLAQAEVWDDVSSLLAEHGVATVADLPADARPASLSEVTA